METNEQVKTKGSLLQTVFQRLQNYLNSRILGQNALIDRLLIALLCDGHLIVEGAPGLAKTKAIKELSQSVEGDFHRIQFTPDLLPADITGTEVFRYQEGTFAFQQGPLFHNLILADEINRAPAKVQSALLEAMAERQVTVGNKTYNLPALFLVMATQNPIEQEGTYLLPEAQLDRFMLYVKIDYPTFDVERQILQLARDEALDPNNKKGEIERIRVSQEQISKAREQVAATYMEPSLEQYIVQLIVATRTSEMQKFPWQKWLRYGASPRGTISLDKAAKAHAWLHQKDYVAPSDIHAVVFDVLRHRLILSYQAIADNITAEHIINEMLNQIPLP